MGAPKKKFDVKYLPFSPGIPWATDKNGCILPQLPISILDNLVETKKEIILTGFGGLIETYYGLSILENLNYHFPNFPIYWIANKQFDILYSRNNIAKFSSLVLDQNILNQFPSPIFLDKEDRIYFNYLNNYLNVTSWNKKYSYNDYRPIIQQISEKSTTDWQPRFIPQFRDISISSTLQSILNKNKFNPNFPFVLIIPDSTNLSNHNISCLDWDAKQIRVLTSLLSQKEIKVVILSVFPHKYAYSNAFVLNFSLDNFIYLSQFAKLTLSKDIDYLLMLQSPALSPKIDNYLSLSNNAEFLDKTNIVNILNKEVEPIDVYNFIKENL